MIENTSTLTREDMRMMIELNNRCAIQYIRRGLALAYGLGVLLFAMWLLYKESSFAYWTNTAMTIIGYTLGPYCIINAIFHKQLMLRKAMKEPAFRTPRQYRADAEGMTVRIELGGVASETHFGYDKAEYYFLHGDAVCVRMRMDKKQIFYLWFHDGNYAQGDRVELITLLEQKGIAEKDV